jgi:hypothetical protein
MSEIKGGSATPDDRWKEYLGWLLRRGISHDDNSKSSKSDIDLVAALLASRAKSDKSNLSKEEKTELLKRRYSSFVEKKSFVKGCAVKWKPGLRNKGGLEYDEIAVVLDVLEKAIYDENKDSGSAYFKEPLDLVIAFLDADNDFVTLHLDSRRMQPVEDRPID